MSARAHVFLAISCFLAACAAPSHTVQTRPVCSDPLRPGDLVNVVIFAEPRLSGPFALDKKGMIALPHFDPIDANGLTCEGLAKRIKSAIEERAFMNANVHVDRGEPSR